MTTRKLLNWINVDRFYRAFIYSKFFNKGWGSPDNMQRLFEMRATFADLQRRQDFLKEDHPITIIKETVAGSLRYIEGEFMSPLYVYHPALFEPPVERARFEMVIPENWKSSLRPLCIHMAGTGDHGYWRRRTWMSKPLALKHGIGSITLINPFYGTRKPKDQFASCLKNVTDLFVMGGSLIFEGMTLLNWAERRGFGPLALTGISMGGHMASLAAAHWPKPVALVPCLSWSTASQCFTEGVLAKAVNFKLLEEAYHSEKFQRQLNDARIAQSLATGSGKNYGLGRYFALHYEEMTMGRAPLRWSRYRRASLGRAAGELKKVEVLDFMRGVLDEFTHLANFPRPADPELIIAVEAEIDAYIPRDGVMDLAELWPGCEVRVFPEYGHVMSCLLQAQEFRKAIVDALDRTAKKYYSDGYVPRPLLTPGLSKPDLVKWFRPSPLISALNL